MPSIPTGEHLLATILKHDSKTTSYKFALLRALNDVVLGHPDLALTGELPVAAPLTRLAEWWLAYYWGFADPERPILQGRPARRGDTIGHDMGLRPALAQLLHLPATGIAHELGAACPTTLSPCYASTG